MWPFGLNVSRLARFARKPSRKKVGSVGIQWVRRVPAIPFPVRLPWGDWWLAENDACGLAILQNCYESSEREVVQRLIQPGMTVLDIGAHHGYYTLLASYKAGKTGRVIAFEPSLREREKLLRHLRLNRRNNVTLLPVALGGGEGEGDLFIVESVETGCNSLRPPDVAQRTSKLRVPITTLDSSLARHGISQVGFVKMDVEGAELSVLKGATKLLKASPRPVFLCEVEERRTRPWGYSALEVLRWLEEAGFHWFRPVENEPWEPIGPAVRVPEMNLLAVPKEKIETLRKMNLVRNS